MKLIKKFNSINPIYVAVVFTVWGLILRFMAYTPARAGDAKKQYDATIGPLKTFWSNNIHYSDLTSFPGYYLIIYPFVQLFDYSNILVETPNIISTIFCFVLLYLICKQYFKGSIGFIIAFIVVTLNISLINHSIQLRPYAFLQTFSLMSLYIWDMLIRREIVFSAFQKVLIVFTFVFLSIFHAFGEVMMGLTLVFVVLSKADGKNPIHVIKPHFKLLLIIFSITLPLWIYYGTGNPMDLPKEGYLHVSFDYYMHTFYYIPNPMSDMIGFLKAVFGNLIGNKFLYVLLLPMCIFFFIPTESRYKQIGFFLLLIILPLTAICLAAVLKKYWFIQRQFVWVMPLYAFFLGWQWDGVVNKFIKS